MAVRNNPDGTYQIDTPGYDSLRYQKIYNHPRRFQAFKTSLNAALEKGLIFPSLDEAIALRCAANGQYNADKPLFTRTVLWQWVESGERFILLDSDTNPNTSFAVEHAADFCGNNGTLVYRKDTANSKLRRRLNSQGCTRIRYTFEKEDISLDDLAGSQFVKYATGAALEPYKKWLLAKQYTKLSPQVPHQDRTDNHVLVHLCVLGTENNLLAQTTNAFCQGIRERSVKQPKAL